MNLVHVRGDISKEDMDLVFVLQGLRNFRHNNTKFENQKGIAKESISTQFHILLDI